MDFCSRLHLAYHWLSGRTSAGVRGAERFRLRASNQGKRAGAGRDHRKRRCKPIKRRFQSARLRSRCL